MIYQIHTPTLDSILSSKEVPLVIQSTNRIFHRKLTWPECANTDYLSFLPHVELVENHAALIAACPALFADSEFKDFLKAGIVATIPAEKDREEAYRALDSAFAIQQEGNSLNTFHTFHRLLGGYLSGAPTVVRAINNFINIQSGRVASALPVGNPAAYSFSSSPQPQENEMSFLVHTPMLNVVLDNTSTTSHNQEINRLFKERLVQAALPRFDYYSCLPYVRVAENHAALLTACPALRGSNEFKTFLKTEVVKFVDNHADKSEVYNAIDFTFSTVHDNRNILAVYDCFCKLLATTIGGGCIGQLIVPFITGEAFKPNPSHAYQPHQHQQQRQNWPAPPNGAFAYGNPFDNPFFLQQSFPPPIAPPGFVVPADQRKVEQLEKEVAQLKEQLGSLTRAVAALTSPTQGGDEKQSEGNKEGCDLTPENPVDVVMQSEFHSLKERLLKMKKHAQQTMNPFDTSSAISVMQDAVNSCIRYSAPPSHEEMAKALGGMDW